MTRQATCEILVGDGFSSELAVPTLLAVQPKDKMTVQNRTVASSAISTVRDFITEFGTYVKVKRICVHSFELSPESSAGARNVHEQQLETGH